MASEIVMYVCRVVPGFPFHLGQVIQYGRDISQQVAFPVIRVEAVNIGSSGLFFYAFNRFLLCRFRRFVIEEVVKGVRQVLFCGVGNVNFPSRGISREVVGALIERGDYPRTHFFGNDGSSFPVMGEIVATDDGIERWRERAFVHNVQFYRRFQRDGRSQLLSGRQVHFPFVTVRLPIWYAKNFTRCRRMRLFFLLQVHDLNVRNGIFKDIIVILHRNDPLGDGPCIVASVREMWIQFRFVTKVLCMYPNGTRGKSSRSSRDPFAFSTSGHYQWRSFSSS